MSNYRDDPYWRHRYDEIDREHADMQRITNDDIIRRATEIGRLDREIEQKKRADELDKIRSNLERNRAYAVKSIKSAFYLPQECKDEWCRSLERIPLICPEADEELNSLVAKIERYRKERTRPSRPESIFEPSLPADFPWNFKTPSINADSSIKSCLEAKEVKKAQIDGHRKEGIGPFSLDGIFGPDLFRFSDFACNFRTPSDGSSPIKRRETEQHQLGNEMEKTEIDALLSSLRVVISTRGLYLAIRSRPVY